MGSLSGAAVDLTAPGPIGSTTPSTGAFTTLSATGQFTSTQATGSAPFVVASTTVVTNLNASALGGATFAAPGAIGGGTPSTGAFTTISASGQITSTVTTGTAPLVVASTTVVANLNASALGGATFAAPGAIGGGTPSTGAFTTMTATSLQAIIGNVTPAAVTATTVTVNTSQSMAGASAANLTWATDGGGNIGATGANRPDQIFVKSGLTSAGVVEAALANGFRIASGLYLRSPSDGIATFTNVGITDFTRLNFGGTTSSFPALARSGVILLVQDASGAAGAALQIGSTALTLTGGAFGMPKITASGSAPGASGSKFEVVCGTNAGTAKLIIYAGTSTTAVTVTDNIGSGVTGC